MRRIVVTGMGVVSPLGTGTEAAWARLIAGQSGLRRLPADLAPDVPAQVAGTVQSKTDDVEAASAEHGDRGVSGHAVARVDDDLEPPFPALRDELVEPVGVGVEGVDLAVTAEDLGAVFDLGRAVTQPGHEVGGHGPGVGEAELDAVVVPWVVARGELHARQPEPA